MKGEGSFNQALKIQHLRLILEEPWKETFKAFAPSRHFPWFLHVSVRPESECELPSLVWRKLELVLFSFFFQSVYEWVQKKNLLPVKLNFFSLHIDTDVDVEIENLPWKAGDLPWLGSSVG